MEVFMEQRRKGASSQKEAQGIKRIGNFVIILCVLVLAVGAFILFITRKPQIGGGYAYSKRYQYDCIRNARYGQCGRYFNGISSARVPNTGGKRYSG